MAWFLDMEGAASDSDVRAGMEKEDRKIAL
jgi:hypothetical protein